VSVQVAHIFVPYVLSNLQPYQKSLYGKCHIAVRTSHRVVHMYAKGLLC